MKQLIPLILLALFFFGCKKETVKQGSGTPPIFAPNTPNPFFFGVFDGQEVFLTYDKKTNGQDWSYPHDEMQYGAFIGPTDLETFEEFALLQFGPYDHSGPNHQQYFFSDLAVLPTNFRSESDELRGFTLNYAKDMYTGYSSSYGDQTGSVLTITSNVTASDAFGRPCRLVKGTFNCKLYNLSNLSDVITVNNGSFSLYFAPFEE